MLADGEPCKRIARHLGICTGAVKKRMSRLYVKTGTENSAHLVATALRCGWLGADETTERAA